MAQDDRGLQPAFPVSDHEAETVRQIRELVAAVKRGEALHPRNDYEERLALAVVRWVNYLDPGDVEVEYQRVKGAMVGV